MDERLDMPHVPRSAALGLIAASLIVAVQPARAQSAAPIVRMGAQTIEPAAEPYYGDQAGIFVSNGITPQVTTLGNGAAMIQAVAGSDLDVGEANPLQLAVAMARNIPVQAIAVACIYTKAVANPNFVVAKNSPIKTPKDLIGSTLGVGALGDFNQVSLFAWLEANGVSRTSVKFVELPFAEIGTALQRGQIQGGFIVEPAKSEALRAGLIRDFADTYPAVGPEIGTVVWFASKGWLQKNPDTAKKLVKAIYATGAWANTHNDQAADILSKVTKIDTAVLNRVPRRLFAAHYDPKYVEGTLNLALRYGVLQRPLPVGEFIATI
jgi:NitT/TauT family transport system substrate-binding protein